ncbi:hypothetical protein EDB85DRAFT_2281834 [Lactarius pseudohatsudake]|nr:hypothetical protein EDB85DRAFT_2281834 [Lactarius pseudohatsudake]
MTSPVCFSLGYERYERGVEDCHVPFAASRLGVDAVDCNLFYSGVLSGFLSSVRWGADTFGKVLIEGTVAVATAVGQVLPTHLDCGPRKVVAQASAEHEILQAGPRRSRTRKCRRAKGAHECGKVERGYTEAEGGWLQVIGNKRARFGVGQNFE